MTGPASASTSTSPAISDSSPPIRFWAALRDDLLAHEPVPERSRPRAARAVGMAMTVVRSPGFHMTLLHRLAYASRLSGGMPGRALAAFLFWWVRHAYGCSIATTARIGGGLILPHPQGIVVGAGVEVGPRAWIFQNVTIGGSPSRPGLPTVGADARIYAGAVLSGPIRLGDDVVVGANAVVFRDLASGSIARAPAVEVTTPSPTAAGPATDPPA
jgi:serine O-acetyltransferase